MFVKTCLSEVSKKRDCMSKKRSSWAIFARVYHFFGRRSSFRSCCGLCICKIRSNKRHCCQAKYHNRFIWLHIKFKIECSECRFIYGFWFCHISETSSFRVRRFRSGQSWGFQTADTITGIVRRRRSVFRCCTTTLISHSRKIVFWIDLRRRNHTWRRQIDYKLFVS